MSTTSSHLLERLNPAQRLAVEAYGGPLLVLAGPGSGKTRVITHRIAYLIAERNVPASAILAVTFTNKAAREMTERLRTLVPGEGTQLTVGTFHAICARILRRDGTAIGIPRSFTIADDDDQESIVRRVVKDLDLDDKRNPPRMMLHRISAAKSNLIDPPTFRMTADNYVDEHVAVVYEHYQEALVAANLLDFDDLLVRTVELFHDVPTILQQYQERWQHLLVDEFQDTNIAQYALVRMLGGRYRNVCVVGDEDQSVYSWRQADIRNILNFEHDFPDAKTIVLEQNYRSTGHILSAARAIISPNKNRKDKKLFTDNETGDRLVLFEAGDENEEASYVATQIERAVAAGTARLGDIAVMYRMNSQSRVLEKTFLRRRLPHKVVGMRFFERKEIKDLLGYLRLCKNARDVASFDRIINVPARQIGSKTLADLRQWAARVGLSPPEAVLMLALGEELDPPCPIKARPRAALVEFGHCLLDLQAAMQRETVDRLLESILKRTGYLDYLRDGTQEAEQREENVRELIRVAQEFAGNPPEASLEAFLEDAALAADADEYDESADAVTLITLHAAKGLEFGTVFIVGLEEGICPHSRSVDEPNQLEEERRLLYVGVTRARRRLYLTFAARRTQFGESSPRIYSRFLKDLPDDVLQGAVHVLKLPRREWVTDSPSRSGLRPIAGVGSTFSRAAPAIEPVARPALVEVQPGYRVRHATFGEGVVISVTKKLDDLEVAVAFPNLPLKRLLQSYARLQVIGEK
jgi:DNA helicase-2/ATP-dependent DNA helicase PcrA